MPSTLPSSHFSGVFADYTSSATALAVSGIPTLSQLPRLHAESTAAVTHPHVCMKVEATPESTDVLLDLDFKMELTCQIGTETGQTTREQAMAWLQALRTLFDEDHRSTWQTWIELQTDEYRSGWQIEAIWPQAIVADYTEDKNLLMLTAPFQVKAWWNN